MMQGESLSNKQSFDSYKRKLNCFYCKMFGHTIKDCCKRIADEKKQESFGQSNLVTNNNVGLYVATVLLTKG